MRFGSVKVEKVDPEAVEPPADCDRIRKRGARLLAELEAAMEKQEQVVAQGCSGTLKREIDRISGWQGSPQAAWVCNGQIVDIPLTSSYVKAFYRFQDWKGYYATRCVK